MYENHDVLSRLETFFRRKSMSHTVNLSEEVVQGVIQHLNADHQLALLNYARRLAGAFWAQSAEVTQVDVIGFDLLVRGENGRTDTVRIPFQEPIQSPNELRLAFVNLAAQADPADGVQRVATAQVDTPKASRYLKALCNHFDRKANARYDDNSGHVQFPFGECTLQATENALLIQVVAESETMFARVKNVVSDHLVRFGVNEELVVDWVDAETAPAR